MLRPSSSQQDGRLGTAWASPLWRVIRDPSSILNLKLIEAPPLPVRVPFHYGLRLLGHR